jgi:transcriptional regulator with XRE-family HTH domain
MELHKKIKELRIEKKTSQKMLAKIMQVDQSTISSWEGGRRQPDYEMLRKLCLFFEVSADYLIGIENEDGSKKY